MARSKVPKYAMEKYLPTNVSVEVGGENILVFDYAEKKQVAVHVITAWNPPNSSRTQEENDGANELLRLEIESLGLEAIKARGSDPKANHFEDSWAVVGIAEEEAILLGHKFEQAAIFRITRNRQTVLGCDEKRWIISRGSRRTLGVQGTVDFINDSRNTKYLKRHIDRYFGINDSNEIFQGRNFEWFIKGKDQSMFLPTDFLAISALSVDVPAETQRKLLEDYDDKFTDLLLASIKQEADHLGSVDFSWLWEKKSPIMKLHAEVEKLPGIGRVVCSKLLATKFPNLIPIRDSKVEKLLGIKPTGVWWKPLHELHESVKPMLVNLKGVKSAASTLRALDVLLWMEASDRGL